MTLYGDYHTHTTYSHGKGSVEDNVRAAAAAGLREVAITDHGLRHVAYSLTRKRIKKLREDIHAIDGKYPVRVLLGVEANLTGDGTVDLLPEDYDAFDIVLMGYHKAVLPSRFGGLFSFTAPNIFYDVTKLRFPKRLIARNTAALVHAIERCPVDVLTHINYGMKVEVRPVAEACAAFGTYIELNGKRITYTDAQMEEMTATGVQFIINSDAHRPERVGEVSKGLTLMSRMNLPQHRVVNLCGAPLTLRSKKKNGG